MSGRRGVPNPPPPPPPSHEPLIVVEEAEGGEEEEDEGDNNSLDERFEDDESPPPTPGLLCPDIRDRRKRSLPTPSCASGITASQVRRLSERGTAHTRRDAAFLATLTSAPAPGRRHSVTISRVPPLPVFRPRRESLAGCAPSRPIDPVTSFQLQLDIMDDIAEVKARKVRLKVRKTPSKERVCEVQHLDSQGGLLKAPGGAGSSGAGRRHSEGAPRGKKGGGIVCSDTDLVSLLSLSPSGSPPTGRQEEPDAPTPPASPPPVVTVEAPDPPTPSPPDTPEANKVVWDGGSGSVVDAHQLGTAIEEYLRLQDLGAAVGGASTSSASPPQKGSKAAAGDGGGASSSAAAAGGAAPTAGAAGGPVAGGPVAEGAAAGGGGKGTEDASESSLCSTLKDLFVK